MFISDSELNLIEKGSKDLNMQDISLFWQLTLKTIEDIKVVPNDNLALEMFVLQLIYMKNIGSDQQDLISSKEKTFDISDVKKKIENQKNDLKPINFTKSQIKNTEQIKTLTKQESEIQNKTQIRSFADLINLTEKLKEMELKYDLERNVKLAKFEDGKIEINFNENINKNFIKTLSNFLFNSTGKRWIISLTKNETNKTFHQQKLEAKEKALNFENNSQTFKDFINERFSYK